MQVWDEEGLGAECTGWSLNIVKEATIRSTSGERADIALDHDAGNQGSRKDPFKEVACFSPI